VSGNTGGNAACGQTNSTCSQSVEQCSVFTEQRKCLTHDMNTEPSTIYVAFLSWKSITIKGSFVLRSQLLIFCRYNFCCTLGLTIKLNCLEPFRMGHKSTPFQSLAQKQLTEN